MLYTQDLKTKLFKDKNGKKYTPASLYLGSKKTGGYSILEPSQKEIEIFNGYNDSAFLKINGKSEQVQTVQGKNLYDANNHLYNVSISVGGTKVWLYATGGNRYSVKIPCLPSTTYTLSKSGGDRFGVFCNKTDFDATQRTVLDYEIVSGSDIKEYTFTTPSDAYFICAYLQLITDNLADIQLELGSTATAYEPFVPDSPSPEYPSAINSVENFDLITTNGSGQTKTINFPYTLNRFTDGTADYIEIDNINKTAKLYNNVGNFVLTENIGFTAYTYNNLLGVYSNPLTDLIGNYTRAEGVCSHENRVGAFFANTGTCMWIGVNNSRIYWIGILDALNITTVEEFKTWLGQQTANGNTVKGIYKLKTPTITNLDYDEVTTYYPYTKIYTNATVQPTLDGKLRVQGENKSALDLNPTDAQVSMGNDSALRLRNNFTVACFIKSTLLPTQNQYFLSRYDISTNGRCWGMIRTHTRPAPQNKGLSVLVSSNGTIGNYVYGTGNIDTTDGNWHHMAFTYSDKTVKLYVDGILDVTETVNALGSNDLFDTASAFSSANSYSGLLDDIRYYSRVLTDDEILKLSKGLKVSDTNMVGHWKCNEGKGTTVKNETNIPNTDGVLNAQAKWTNDTIYQ